MQSQFKISEEHLVIKSKYVVSDTLLSSVEFNQYLLLLFATNNKIQTACYIWKINCYDKVPNVQKCF